MTKMESNKIIILEKKKNAAEKKERRKKKLKYIFKIKLILNLIDDCYSGYLNIGSIALVSLSLFCLFFFLFFILRYRIWFEHIFFFLVIENDGLKVFNVVRKKKEHLKHRPITFSIHRREKKALKKRNIFFYR